MIFPPNSCLNLLFNDHMEISTLHVNKVLDMHKLAVVLRGLDGKATLVPVAVNSTDSGQQILEKVKAKQREWMRAKGRAYCLNLLWTRIEIAIAEIRWVKGNEVIHCRKQC